MSREEAHEALAGNAKPEWKPYEYRPLNRNVGREIRLVKLHPGSTTDTIRCDILHADLLSGLQYEAVSYTWATEDGSSGLTNTIVVGNRYLSITLNCLYALWRLRKEDAPRTLWLDAISINQKEVAERNHQVGLMREIYSNASQVLVYIGESNQSAQEILSGVWQRSFEEISLTNSWRSLAGHLVFPEVHPLVNGHYVKSESLAKLRNFFARRWFGRVWVIQEVALAKKAIMVAGDNIRIISPRFLHDIRKRCREHNFVVPGPLRFNPGDRHEFNLLEALHGARNCSSTDPRDKLYALIGLADERTRSNIPIDYSKSLVEVFTRAAAALIVQDQSLDVLSYASFIPAELYRPYYIPTWVPDWTEKVASDQLLPQLLPDEVGPWRSKTCVKTVPCLKQLYHLSSEVSYIIIPPFSESLTPNQPTPLLIHAHYIGSINERAKINRSWAPAHAFGDHLRRWSSTTPDQWPDFLHWIRDTIRLSPSYRGDDAIDWTDLESFCSNLKRRWRNSIVFQAGTFPAVSPKHRIRTGDSVWAVDGYRTPLILRRFYLTNKQSSANDFVIGDPYGEEEFEGHHKIRLEEEMEMETYRIVGPCHLYGLKDLNCWIDGRPKVPWNFDPFRVMEGKSTVIGII